MSFGPRKPATGPSRSSRPTVVKKTVGKVPSTRLDARQTQQPGKPKGPSAVVPQTKKPTSVAPPKPSAPKPSPPKPPSPEPTYDYESDFESDQSAPIEAGSSSSEDPEDTTASETSTSEGGDDENDDNDDDLDTNEVKPIDQTHTKPSTEALLCEPLPQIENVKCEQQNPKNNSRNARSVDILGKISLNDVVVDLYKFDPEEYAELRTHFGVTLTVAHGKHTQPDSFSVSTTQQTSRIATRDCYTSMHGGLRTCSHVDAIPAENGTDNPNDEENVQNYSSLQNIEHMFSTLNDALERRFSNDSILRHGTVPGGYRSGHANLAKHQRSILTLVRRSAPIFEALLEAKRLRARKPESGSNVRDSFLGEGHGERRVTKDVIRSFDTGKMCPEYEVKLLRATNGVLNQTPHDRYVLEFWARGTYSRPMYRFSSWSSLQCVDFECRRRMMVFAGTGDGTLTMWLGDAGRSHNEILPPHQILTPNVGRKHKLSCWEIVTVKVLPVPVAKDSTMNTGTENVLNQVFGLFSTGIIVVWHVLMDEGDDSSVRETMNARFGRPDVSLVQSKVIDLNARIGSRLVYDALRSYGNLLLHDHHQLVLSSDRSVIRLSHFVESEYDPALLIQPDRAHSIVNLKRMAQSTDTIFALYSNKTVRVLKLNTAPHGPSSARHHHRKHDNQPTLTLSVCTNKSCTIQSIVHEEAKRYGNSNSVVGSRADGGTIASRTNDVDKNDSETPAKPRFHHWQQILFFGTCHPDGLLGDRNFN